jgi:DNA-binding GntR family transcriptional regulator
MCNRIVSNIVCRIKDVHEPRIMIEPPVVRKLAATQSARDGLPCRDVLDQQVDDDPVASHKVAGQFLDEVFRQAGNLTLWVLARQLNDIALMHAASACAARRDDPMGALRTKGPRTAH